MARKMKIPKAAQIKGIRKALANRKTPRGFIPGLRKRLAKLTAAVAILFLLNGYLARTAHAQTPVTIVPTQQTLATSVACTGSAQTFSVVNRNLTQHNAYMSSSGIATMSMQIQGLDLAGNKYTLSDTSTIASVVFGTNPVLTASGYFPYIQVVVTCLPTTGTFTLGYSGGSSTPNVIAGGYQLAQSDKVISAGVPGTAVGTATSLSFQAPFGDSFGILYFNNSATGSTGATVAVACDGQAANTGITYTFYPATSSGLQSFNVPDAACPTVSIVYTAGTGGSGTYSLEYVFPQPSFRLTNSYTHITGTTATVVKAGPGVVHTVVVGTPAAGTISLFDLAPASCTSTPSTNVVSVITATSTFPAAPEIYDALFLNGICVKASATMDITISSQ
jgi:hypothetical protein